jgi:hypothetical protein
MEKLKVRTIALLRNIVILLYHYNTHLNHYAGNICNRQF